MAVGTHKGYVQIWDVAASKRITSLDGHSARVGKTASTILLTTLPSTHVSTYHPPCPSGLTTLPSTCLYTSILNIHLVHRASPHYPQHASIHLYLPSILSIGPHYPQHYPQHTFTYLYIYTYHPSCPSGLTTLPSTCLYTSILNIHLVHRASPHYPQHASIHLYLPSILSIGPHYPQHYPQHTFTYLYIYTYHPSCPSGLTTLPSTCLYTSILNIHLVHRASPHYPQHASTSILTIHLVHRASSHYPQHTSTSILTIHLVHRASPLPSTYLYIYTYHPSCPSGLTTLPSTCLYTSILTIQPYHTTIRP